MMNHFLLHAGCHVVSEVESGSPSTVSDTSTWCWSPMLPEQGTSCGWVWRDPERDGWAWAETGGRTGSPTPNWSDSLCRLGLQAATDAPPPHGTSPLRTGSSDRLSPGRTLGFDELMRFISSFAPSLLLGAGIAVTKWVVLLVGLMDGERGRAEAAAKGNTARSF